MAQVTIYGPLVTVVLSLRPAPSEKWCPLLNPLGGLPPSPGGLSRLGQVAQPGSRERKDCCGEPILPLARPSSPRHGAIQASWLKLPLLANKRGRSRLQ